MENDGTILRAFAVLGLVAALVTGVTLAVRSGVIGGGNAQATLTTATLADRAAAAAATSPDSNGAQSALDASSGSQDTGGSSADSSTTGQDAGGAGASTTDQSGATTTASKTYVVQSGDTFFSIANKFNTTIATIQKLNPGVDPQHLSAGVKLKVPQ